MNHFYDVYLQTVDTLRIVPHVVSDSETQVKTFNDVSQGHVLAASMCGLEWVSEPPDWPRDTQTLLKPGPPFF